MAAGREWCVSVSDIDTDAQEVAVQRIYLVSEEQAQAVMDMLGDSDETVLFGKRSHEAALEAYDAAVRL